MSQYVEQVSHTHQEVESLHGVPAVGKEVLVIVAVAFLDQDTALYSPSMTRSQVAAFVYVTFIERMTREPSMTGCHRYGLAGFGVDLFPGFFANDNMDRKALFLILSLVIVDIVYPLELLLSIAPLHRKTVIFFELF